MTRSGRTVLPVLPECIRLFFLTLHFVFSLIFAHDTMSQATEIIQDEGRGLGGEGDGNWERGGDW